MLLVLRGAEVGVDWRERTAIADCTVKQQFEIWGGRSTYSVPVYE
jgi:hypothetical protein